ncbi:MAG TPA: glycosyltransferase [Chitinophagaceae bacterium]
MKKYHLTISVVLYKNNPSELRQLVNCISQTQLNYELFLIDNSPTDALKTFGEEENIRYYFINKNMGFGKAQNIAIRNALDKSEYHLILNPDISFKKGTLEDIYAFMEANSDIGQLMPKVYYDNGNIQKLCKLLPHPADLIGRRFFLNFTPAQKRNKTYELNGFAYDKVLDIPCLSGCFMFIRSSVLRQVGGFDPRYFMYLEDIDLTRRINKVSRTVFYPNAQVKHAFKKGSYGSIRLLRYHIVSAIKYFNKWGWFFDDERDIFNKEVLSRL